MFDVRSKKYIGLIMALVMLTGLVVFSNTNETYAKGKPKVKKIKINPKTVTLTVGDRKKLKVSFTPKRSKRKVKWSSSDKKVAVVKNGTVKAKKIGSATVTAKVGNKRAKCRIKVEKGVFISAESAYSYLNEFRGTKGVWQWEIDNVTKKYFNTSPANTLQPLKKDAKLEKTAKQRAKELIQSFGHTRPDGSMCFTVYPKGLTAMGENLAYGYSNAKSVTEAWKEEEQSYDYQGHRRNMLFEHFTHVGIAAYKYGGTIYWVQSFGRK